MFPVDCRLIRVTRDDKKQVAVYGLGNMYGDVGIKCSSLVASGNGHAFL